MGKPLPALLGGLLLGLMLMGAARQAHAQSGIEVADARVLYYFGNEIEFSGRVESEYPLKEALLIFRDVSEENTRVIPLTLDEAGHFTHLYDASENLLRPFAEISWWLQVTLENEESFASEKFFFTYADNRFAWETRQDGMLSLHWAEGDEAFGLAALDAARAGLAEIQRYFPLSLDAPVDIYLYASPLDLQNALFLGGESWMAGHASPDLGVVLVAIAPGSQQAIHMQQKIPHELAHILLYRYVGENYNSLPNWLIEGVASLVERYPNPDFSLALERAEENDSLIPISTLCPPFPQDASLAFLAYAEAESFTRYIYEEYGSSGLDALLFAYADGLSCETGATRALGTSLSMLDMQWRERVLGSNLLEIALRALRPFFALLGVILATFLAEFSFSAKR